MFHEKGYNTYKKSGVNMAIVNKLVNHLSEMSKRTYKTFTYQKKIYFNFCIVYTI